MSTVAAVTATPPRLPRGRRYAVRGLLAAAAVLAVLAIASVWANRQALDADNWASTSSAMLQDPAIRDQVATFVVDSVYDNVDVNAQVAQALPPRLQPLAGPAAGALRNFAEERTKRVLARPRIERLWEQASRATAQQFINIAKNDSGAITTSGNAVVLDLRAIVLNVVRTLGLPGTVAAKIPPGAARIKIMSADQIHTVQNGTSVLQGFAVVLPVLAIALLALAVYLARGLRRQTLLEAGCVLIGAGLFVLIARRLAGTAVVESLASTDAAKPAAQSTWSIGTRILRDAAQATVIAGIPVVAAAWLAGPGRRPVALRRRAAPTLRDQPGLAYGALGLVLVAIVAWGPIPATRSPLPILLMVALAVAGLAALRRQTAQEFPAAIAPKPGGGDGGSDGAVPAPPPRPAAVTMMKGGPPA